MSEWIAGWEQLADGWLLTLQSLGIWFLLAGFLLNIICNLTGIPTLLLTAANVGVYGPVAGLLISWFGEMCGSWLAFVLFGKGLRKFPAISERSRRWTSFLRAERQWQRIAGIAMLRFSMLPSNVITLICSGAGIGSIDFLIGTAIGKFPSILLESLVARQLIEPSAAGLPVLMTILCLVWVVLMQVAVRQKEKQIRNE